ncbi:hypothetical protein L5515_000275 [Caenorhabditis briggsae]|uniref:Transmembrane protein n=1 Tax=Caenorhabditis briggsae TaxID=6238 RepID=A0AAE9J1H9_CAEBR|nr:hypothetical protein L5515_000275 [Caenorhabditis briggsae]
MSFQEHHNSNNNIDMNMMVDASSRAVAGKGKKKKTAHFKKRGHPAFKVMFIVFALLTLLSIIMACVSGKNLGESGLWGFGIF